MKVLITHPEVTEPGGVAGLYAKLHKHFGESIYYLTIGCRAKDEKSWCVKAKRIILDYILFVRCLHCKDIDIVHVNPSFDLKSFIRDGLFVFWAKMTGRKVIVFYHGWLKEFEVQVERYFLWLFRITYGKSDAFVVLSNQVIATLRKWKMKQPIYKSFTVISDEEFEEIDIDRIKLERQLSGTRRILFLSRITKEKGIYETIEALALLRKKFPSIELIVAGEGSELEAAKKYVSENDISCVYFKGYVTGKTKQHTFESCHIYCLPSYSEGLPGTVIEAMAYGLPVVATPVGGIPDIFENEKHGYFASIGEPAEIAEAIEKLLLDETLYKTITDFNYNYVREKFLASSLASQLSAIYGSFS